MNRFCNIKEITIGYHPDGYRIDKTVSPLNWYTKWEITETGHWHNPKCVPFNDMPQTGWMTADNNKQDSQNKV